MANDCTSGSEVITIVEISRVALSTTSAQNFIICERCHSSKVGDNLDLAPKKDLIGIIIKCWLENCVRSARLMIIVFSVGMIRNFWFGFLEGEDFGHR